MEEHHNGVESQLDWLLRHNQMNLGELDRERLLVILEGMLQGQMLVFHALAAETRQSGVIAAQRDIISGLQAQITAANQTLEAANHAVASLEEPQDDYYRTLMLALAGSTATAWSGSQESVVAFEQLITGVWRGVERAMSQGDLDPGGETATWWKHAARENFGFPRAIEEKEEADEKTPEDDDG